jgi:hypothetical protein
MTLDVTMHSTVAVAGSPAQSRWGFTVTSDKDTAVGAYLVGEAGPVGLVFGLSNLTAGTRHHGYISHPAAGNYRLRWHTFAFGTSPPGTEPTDRHPEHEFFLQVVAATTRNFELKDMETGMSTDSFITFIRKDSPHLYNTVTKPDGQPSLYGFGVVPSPPDAWVLNIAKRIDDKTMYYELIDPTTIPEDTISTILLPKRSEALVKAIVTVDFSGLTGVLRGLLLLSDPLWWALVITGAISPQHAAWILNTFFGVVFPSHLKGQVFAFKTVDPLANKYEIDVRVTPDSLKFWTQLAKQVAKGLARFIPGLIILVGVYFVIHELRLFSAPSATIIDSIGSTITRLQSEQAGVIKVILENPDLTPEQKIQAIEAVNTSTREMIASLEKTLKDFTPPFPWGPVILVGVGIIGAVILVSLLTRTR